MTNFHSLELTEVKRETEEAVSLLFNVPADLKSKFAFIQGQYLTLRTQINGVDIRRSYSICSSPYSSELRVSVKQIPNGVFSTHANNSLQAGDFLDVMPPLGSFYTDLKEINEKHYGAFASGSGITPIMSILRATLIAEPKSTFTLFYGNKTKESALFYSDLEALKELHPNRFNLHHIFSRVSDLNSMYSGRLSADKCTIFHKNILDFSTLDEVFLCGPEEMIFDVKDALLEIGLPENNIHFELFTAAKPTIKSEQLLNSENVEAKVEVIIDGESYNFDLSENGETILDAAMAVDADVPFACKGGVCCACKAKVMEGTVKMDVNYALDEEEVAEGYVLTCQSHPTSAKLIIDFDEI